MITYISNTQLYYIAFRCQFNCLKPEDQRSNKQFQKSKRTVKSSYEKNDEIIQQSTLKKRKVIKSSSCSEIFIRIFPRQTDYVKESKDAKPYYCLTTQYLLANRTLESNCIGVLMRSLEINSTRDRRLTTISPERCVCTCFGDSLSKICTIIQYL